MGMNLMRCNMWSMNQRNNQIGLFPLPSAHSPEYFKVLRDPEQKVDYLLIVNSIPSVLTKILSGLDFSGQDETVLLELKVERWVLLIQWSKKRHGQNFAAEEISIFLLPCDNQVPWTLVSSLWWENFCAKPFKALTSQQFPATSQSRKCDISL